MAELREEENTTTTVSNVNVFEDATHVEENEVVFDTNLYNNLSVYESPDLNKAISRWTFLHSVDWSTTDPVETQLFLFSPISSIINGSTFIKQKLSDFTYFRATVELEFRVNTSPISAGLAMVAWVYSNNVTSYLSDKDVQELSNLPHLVFDMAEQSVLKLTIPFKQCRDYYAMASTQNRPMVIVKTLTGFLSGDATNVSNACISVYGRLVDLELAAPNSVVPQSSMTTVGVSNKEISHESVFETKTLKDGLSCVELMTGKESNTAQQVVPHFRLRSVGPLNQVDMPNTSEKFAMLKDGYHYMDHEIMGDPVDYDNIITYGQIPGLLTGRSFSDAAGHGELLMLYYQRRPSVPTQHHHVPLHAFGMYRGSWKFHFRFVCSKFTTARVLFAFVPGSAGAPVSAELAMSKYETRVVDIQGTTSYDVEIPYLLADPWLATTNRHSTLAMYCVNPPINPNGTEADSQIQVVAWASLGSDMQYAQPTFLHFSDLDQSVAKDNITPQSTTNCDMRAHFRQAFPPLTPILGKTVRFNLSGNDQIHYWTDFLKRFQGNIGGGSLTAFHILGGYNFNAYIPWLAYFQRIFTRSSGCIRLKFESFAPRQYWKDNDLVNNLWNFSGQTIVDPTAPNSEIEVPSSMLYHFIDTNAAMTTNTQFPWISTPELDTYYMAAGEDYTLGFPCFLPTIYPYTPPNP